MRTDRPIKQSSNRKTHQISSSERIRNNQRQSRARRKEYIQDLEKRLQKFQTEGVQATREVQEAGRKVAVENSLLRTLLTLHGVSDQTVQEYLKSHTKPVSLPTSRLEFVQETQAPLRKSARLNPVDSGEPSPSSCERNGILPERTAAESSLLASNPNHASFQHVATFDSPVSNGDLELSIPLDSSTDTSALQPPNRHPENSGQSTPCETAARIISSMRSYPDMQDVRSELGCQSSASCMVKNLDIFQLLN